MGFPERDTQLLWLKNVPKIMQERRVLSIHTSTQSCMSATYNNKQGRKEKLASTEKKTLTK